MIARPVIGRCSVACVPGTLKADSPRRGAAGSIRHVVADPGGAS
jgi:hypothetical protein